MSEILKNEPYDDSQSLSPEQYDEMAKMLYEFTIIFSKKDVLFNKPVYRVFKTIFEFLTASLPDDYDAPTDIGDRLANPPNAQELRSQIAVNLEKLSPEDLIFVSQITRALSQDSSSTDESSPAV